MNVDCEESDTKCRGKSALVGDQAYQISLHFVKALEIVQSTNLVPQIN